MADAAAVFVWRGRLVFCRIAFSRSLEALASLPLHATAAQQQYRDAPASECLLSGRFVVFCPFFQSVHAGELLTVKQNLFDTSFRSSCVRTLWFLSWHLKDPTGLHVLWYYRTPPDADFKHKREQGKNTQKITTRLLGQTHKRLFTLPFLYPPKVRSAKGVRSLLPREGKSLVQKFCTGRATTTKLPAQFIQLLNKDRSVSKR